MNIQRVNTFARFGNALQLEAESRSGGIFRWTNFDIVERGLRANIPTEGNRGGIGSTEGPEERPDRFEHNPVVDQDRKGVSVNSNLLFPQCLDFDFRVEERRPDLDVVF